MKIKRAFEWPAQGRVSLISVSFHYGYDFRVQKLAMRKSYETYVTSYLSWQKNEETGVFDFKLVDKDVFNSEKGDVKNLKFNEVEFMVDFNGVFVSVHHRPIDRTQAPE